MIIRNPNQIDIERMYELFLSAQVSKSELTKKNVAKRGFFEYDLSYEAFASRVAEKEANLILERNNEIIAYTIALPISQIPSIQKIQHDQVLEDIKHANPKTIYWDQLFLKPNLPIYFAGRLFETMNHKFVNENVPAIIGAIPQDPWQNISSTRFVLAHGFKRESNVKEGEITLGLFTKPFWKKGEEISENYKLLN